MSRELVNQAITKAFEWALCILAFAFIASTVAATLGVELTVGVTLAWALFLNYLWDGAIAIQVARAINSEPQTGA